MPAFRPAREVLPRAIEVLERERARLRAVVDGRLELTGGSSVPEALTGGDIDLHLRVEPASFGAAVDALRAQYRVAHPEIWCETLATFEIPGDEPVGVALTPVGSAHDRRFVAAWEALRTDPSALRAYNAMKRAHADGGEGAYLAAKARFFDALASTDEGALPPQTDAAMPGPPPAAGRGAARRGAR